MLKLSHFTGVIRLAGAGRYETNAIVVDTFKSDAALNLNSVFIASGENTSLIDALAGSGIGSFKRISNNIY